MKIINFDLKNPISIKEPIVACIGYFDGLHLGHRALIKETLKRANFSNAKSCLITFNPAPINLLKGKDFKHIESFKERLKKIEYFGFDYCIVLNFNDEMANLSYQDFYQLVLKQFNLKYLICGFDFHYGKDGLGNYETLCEIAKESFGVIKIDSVNYENEKVSSSRIRNAIAKGDLDLASALLGYRYYLKGEVIHGNRLGREIGFPTANLRISNEVLLPEDGVYFGYVEISHEYKALISVGSNPTICEDDDKKIEVYIIDFNGILYGENIKVIFKEKMRDIIHFNSLEALALQLKKDEQSARAK